MKKHELIIKITIFFTLLLIILLLIIFSYKYDALYEQYAVKNISGIRTNVTKDQCYLCGNVNTRMHSYFGQENLGFLNLNTFNFTLIEMQSYDEQGQPVFDDKRNLRSQAMSDPYGGSEFQIESLPSYHFAAGTITLRHNSRLDLIQTKKYLCADCLSQLVEQMNGRLILDCALIDLKTKEIYLINPLIKGKFFNQYYIASNFCGRTNDFEEWGTIYLNIHGPQVD